MSSASAPYSPRKIVVLDPGHGGHDPGALGQGGTRESDMALDVCLRAQKILAPFVKVILTRTTDTFISLNVRPRIANDVGADAFISYHFNSGSDPATKNSWELFTTPGQNNSDTLATCIGEEHAQLFRHLQTAREDRSDGDLDKEANFAVLRPTHCPSCLMEGEFIHTLHGESLILDPHNREKMAMAVARGVLRFLDITLPPSVPPPLVTVPKDPGNSYPPPTPLTIEERIARLETKVFSE